MADRVKPDGWAPVLVPAPEYIDADTGVVYSGRYVDEATFARSTILRVIDEEIEDCLSDADSDGAGALSALRDRFEEADDE